ncbi:hypothetical protein MMC29_002877 [Sticta canariensis]|nr:hypothetical protein [Sticta canariensis]
MPIPTLPQPKYARLSQLITVVKTDDFSSISTTRTEVIGGYMNAYGVQIRFQATDLQHISATTSTATPTSSPGATTSATTTPPPNSTQTHTPPPRPTLSAGAKAGIGVGTAFAVCIGLVLFWLGWRCTERPLVSSAHAAELEGKGDSEPRKIDGEIWFPEMQGTALSEAPGNNLHQEVEGHQIAQAHELEGRRR